VIVRDANHFDLALHAVDDSDDRATSTGAGERALGPLHPFLHFGFRLRDPRAVRALLVRMRGDGVPIVESNDEPGYVAFKCTDPDGHRVEVYWED
jgi:catechol 2,3-dioxygenase-like lactoylglutathione lyase family enzyme